MRNFTHKITQPWWVVQSHSHSPGACGNGSRQTGERLISENQNKNLKSLLENTKYFGEDFLDKENFIKF